MNRELIKQLIATLLIFLFIYTAASKLMNFHDFTISMHRQPLPNWLAQLLIYTLPPIEIVACLFLMSKRQPIGFYISLGLMSAFTVYVACAVLHVFKNVPCSCGGVIKSLTWKQHLAFNIFFLAVSIFGVRLSKPSRLVHSSTIRNAT